MTDSMGDKGPSGPRAGFGIRFVGFLIDGIVLSLASLVFLLSGNLTLFYVLSTALTFLYFGYLEGSPSGQTIGKRAVGIRVIAFPDGGPIGFNRGLVRTVGRYVSQAVCFLGYFWMLWDREKQTWCDKLAESVVVPTSAYPVEAWPG